MSTHRLERVFNPKSVALAGASPREGSTGKAVLDNLRAGGFKGRLDLIHPTHKEVDGLPCVASLRDLPSAPDLLVVCTPEDAVIPLVEEAAAMGVASALVLTPDPTPGDNSLYTRLKKISDKGGIRIIGPNSLGILAPRAKLNASYAALQVKAGDLAVISQSGAIAAALIAWSARRNVGFSGLVSVGATADVDFADLLDYYALDPQTRAILIYVENFADPQAFMSAARAASRVKPVIAVKSGRNRQAQRAATHVGNLATPDAVYDAAFRRAGLLRVADIDELFDAAEALGRIKPFPGKRLAILTNGGGISLLAADKLIDMGGELAGVSPEAAEKIAAVMPQPWTPSNPVDIEGDADGPRFAAALAALAADKSNDAILVMNAPTALSKSVEVAEAIAAAVKKARAATLVPKPVFTVWYGGSEETDRIFEAARIPHYQTGAISGFMHLVRWREAREFLMNAPPSMPENFAPDTARAREIVQGVIKRGGQWLTPIETSDLLEAYDIPAAPARLARTPEEAAELARLMISAHGACVIKILSPDIQHKSDVGGVVLELKSVQAVANAAREMLDRVKTLMPEARIDGVSVHPMIKRPHGRELLAGIADDPTFGPVIVFGRGGKAVEMINDRALALPPLDLSLARDLIERTRVVRVLRNYRDVPEADIDAVALTLVKLAQLSADVPEIRELDLNPLLADEYGVVAMDARVVVKAVPSARAGEVNPRFAVAPYPKHWERHIALKDGSPVLVRAVRPEDEEMYRSFFENVTAEDLRLRFFAPVKEFSHAFIARLTQIDYARAFAIAAIREDNGLMLGGVRLMLDANREVGEYAILLRSDLKGQGLGWKLMKLMIEYAETQGLRCVEGQVLSENVTMLAMCQALGFKIKDDPHEHGVKLVKLDLTAVPAAKKP